MTDTAERFEYTTTHPTPLAYLDAIEPRAYKPRGMKVAPASSPLMYGGTLVYSPDDPDLLGIQTMLKACANARWPGRALSELKFPRQDGNKAAQKRIRGLEKAGKKDDGKGDWMLGKILIKTSSKFQPKLSLLQGKTLTDIDPDNAKAFKSKFYSGVEALVRLTFVAYPAVKDGDPDGVTAYLEYVASTGKGKTLSTGGKSASEVFSGYVGNVTDVDPTSGDLDDGIPF